MFISAIDLFSIGIGPSSSHTVGPMRAAKRFAEKTLHDRSEDATINFVIHGSLAATGKGHGTDRAVILGLAGYEPTTVPSDLEPAYGSEIPTRGTISGPLGSLKYQFFSDPQPLDEHPNALSFWITDDSRMDNFPESWGSERNPHRYYSVGGGFVLDHEEFTSQSRDKDLGAGASTQKRRASHPYQFDNAQQLLAIADETGMSIPEIVMANEVAEHGSAEVIEEHLDKVWETMSGCVKAGISTTGTLPGGLNVRRRAPELFEYVNSHLHRKDDDPLWAMEWVNLYALAVNEENAAGGRVVTAPTNGAAGIIPAVLHYARDFRDDFDATSHREFLLAAAAVAMIIKRNASISGAEVGCQGEVGSASAMAAAGLAQILGATPHQVEHAAEIALEHNLGLTCDPVGGLVQVPCIERNAIGAVKSINAARMACLSSSQHLVSLDDVIKTMAETGRDMLTKYKETATGGLAVNLGFPVNLTEC